MFSIPTAFLSFKFTIFWNTLFWEHSSQKNEITEEDIVSVGFGEELDKGIFEPMGVIHLLCLYILTKFHYSLSIVCWLVDVALDFIVKFD